MDTPILDETEIYDQKCGVLMTINGKEYKLRRSLFETFDISNAITDSGFDTLEFKWDISPENIEVAFYAAAKKYDTYFQKNMLSDDISVILFLRYLGVELKILMRFMKHMLYGPIIYFVDECAKIPYHEIMLFIFERYDRWTLYNPSNEQDTLKGNFETLVKKILTPHFPIEFQTKVILESALENMTEPTKYSTSAIPSSVSHIIFGPNFNQPINDAFPSGVLDPTL
uniref:BTB domain-containing protein n=1 Tax=viral metagenome TaxID=1070528 RepID=A0A6C0CB54_9ZZZZ